MIWNNKNMLSKRHIPEPPLNLCEVVNLDLVWNLLGIQHSNGSYVEFIPISSNIPWIVTLNLCPKSY